MFDYQNKLQGIKQSFGVNIKKYFAHQKKEIRFDRASIPRESRTQSEVFDNEISEGAYIFLPEWNRSHPELFGLLN